MVRYYYTDPRKASLMLSEHNIHMYMGNYENNDFDAYKPFMATMLIEDCLYRTRYLEKFRNWDGKIYVLPDCHEMLKPQIGDLVEAIGIHNNSKFGLVNGASAIWVSSDTFECGAGTVKIIQRNGKAFFAPEFEEVT